MIRAIFFADAVYDGRALENKILIQAGGDLNAGYQGLRFDAQLSLASPNNESNFVYSEDGYSLMISKLEAYVDGDVTLDVTRAGDIGGEAYYDGLRIGFEDLAFGYKTEGFRIGEDTGNANDLKNVMVISVQKEFEHNMAQQLYASQKLWDIISLSKNDIISLIINTSKNLGDQDNADSLASALMTQLSQMQKSPLDIAILGIKEEAKIILNV